MRRLYSLVSPDGSIILHWRTSETDARHYADINHPQSGDRLVGPTGKTLRTY
jgi:hypothetical protein